MTVVFEDLHILGWLYLVFLMTDLKSLLVFLDFHVCFLVKKPLKMTFTMVKFILSGTSSHFNLVTSWHVADLFSTKPEHAFCGFNKPLIWYCGKLIDK